MIAVLVPKVHAEKDLVPDHVRNQVQNQDSLVPSPVLVQSHPRTTSQDLTLGLPNREGLHLLTREEIGPTAPVEMMMEMMIAIHETTERMSMMMEQKIMQMIKHYILFLLDCCAVIRF